MSRSFERAWIGCVNATSAELSLMKRREVLLAAAVAALAACSDPAPSEPVDAGGVVDTGNPVEDTGNPVEDTGNPVEDTGNPVEDTGNPVEDTGTVPTDTGPSCTSGQIECAGGCVDPQTNPAHCGACGTMCGASEECRAGVCTPTMTCPMGQLLCGGGCVNPQTDANNCGTCGTACSASQTCTAGACVAAMNCPTGQTACGMTCVDTSTSTANCGSCGAACGMGETCVGGVCQQPSCPSGQSRCMGACSDLQTDAANCGMCGRACASSETCTAGMCRPSCAAPRQNCTIDGAEVCTDVQTSAAHCGMCGNACAAGQVCTAGRCGCPTGRRACGMACVDTASDNANCGACGTVCPSGQTCTMGACACPTGLTRCGTGAMSTCVNTQSDTANCGMCGRACTAPSTCNSGMCNSLCGAGTTSCGGRCVAVTTFQTDRNNCGRCGNVCATGTACTAGVCRPTNDARASAITLVPSAAREVTATGTTVNATNDGPSVPCACTSGGNVWYRFTVPSPGGVVYFDTAGSAFDTSLHLTNSTGVALPAQASAGSPNLGLCNDDARCATGGGFTAATQSRTAGVLAAGTYFVAVGGCGAGTFTLRMQYLPRNVGSNFINATLTGTGNVSGTTAGTAVSSGTCGGTGGSEDVRWFVSCGAGPQLFSVCRSDPGASWVRQRGTSSSPTYDPAMYVRSAQTGAQVSCNDDGGTMGGTDCRGTVVRILPPSSTLDSRQYGSRLNNLQTPRGLNAVFIDSLSGGAGLIYNLRYQVQ